jgi:hypothetical protein
MENGWPKPGPEAARAKANCSLIVATQVLGSFGALAAPWEDGMAAHNRGDHGPAKAPRVNVPQGRGRHPQSVNPALRWAWVVLFVRDKEVLVDFPVFHDDQEVLGGILDEFDVLQRVAVHQQQIGQCAFFHHTELAGIGIAGTG